MTLPRTRWLPSDCQSDGRPTTQGSRLEVQPARSLVEQVELHVLEATYFQVKNLLVEEQSGRVIIRGRVRRYYDKQRALEAALDLLPGHTIRLEIEVS